MQGRMPDGAAQSRAAIIRAAVDRICTRSGAEHEVPLRPPTVLSAVGPGSQITLSQEFSQENSHSLSQAMRRMPNHVQTSNPNRTAQTANNLAMCHHACPMRICTQCRARRTDCRCRRNRSQMMAHAHFTGPWKCRDSERHPRLR